MSRGSSARLGSTYRLQLNGIGFAGAQGLVPYLHCLGVETLYVSPVLQAIPGSTHGYDVADPAAVDSGLGGAEGLESLLAELDAYGMRLLVDIVPNHMAASPCNRWWWDVLARGPSSPFAPYFDIDWRVQDGRLLLPILGAPLRDELERGSVALAEGETGPEIVCYGEIRLPVAEGSAGAAGGRPPEDLFSVLDRQHYRLAYWKVAGDEGNYRRFFDIDGLVGIRVEVEDVFDATHATILELVADPRVAGLRVDHVDGLADPAGYLRRLTASVAAVRDRPAALVVEKILARDESMPRGWPVDGTTGYEFADLAVGLLVDGEGGPGETGSPSYARRIKTEVAGELFGGTVDRVVRAAADALDRTVPGHDISRSALHRAVIALSSFLPVYRTYLDTRGVAPPDRRRIAHTRAAAVEQLDAAHDGEAVRALEGVCDGLLSVDPDCTEWLPTAQVWQQLSGALAAKGVEDTTLYRVDGRLAMADVGSVPWEAAVAVDRFHAAMAVRQRHYGGGLNTTTTHDSKRGEDVRARLAVLSEIPDRWTALVDRWHRRRLSSPALSTDVPSFHDELVLYQTIVGLWPHDGRTAGLCSRLEEFAVKAAREAKLETSWRAPVPAYERSLRSFVEYLFGPAGAAFRKEVAQLVAGIGPAAATNAWALTTLRLTAPGVPDTYQGCELESLVVVDPDNRRPVDFARRAELLGTVDAGELGPEGMLEGWQDGMVTLRVLSRLLRLRRDRPDVFHRGAYRPLAVRGAGASHVVAFARGGSAPVVVVVPRLVVGLAGLGRFPLGQSHWSTTAVVTGPGPRQWSDVVTGVRLEADRGSLPVSAAFGTLPIAVLVPV